MKFITSKFSIALFVTLIALLGYMVACTKEAEPAHDPTTIVTFAGKSVPTVNTFMKDEAVTDYPRLSHLMADVNAKSATAMVESLTKYFSGDIDRILETPKYVILYTEKSYINIESPDISGISVVTLEGNGLNHTFFKVIGQEAKEDTRFSGYTDFFTPSTIDMLADVTMGKKSMKGLCLLQKMRLLTHLFLQGNNQHLN